MNFSYFSSVETEWRLYKSLQRIARREASFSDTRISSIYRGFSKKSYAPPCMH